MSQQTPPNNPNDPGYNPYAASDAQAAPSFAQDAPPPGANPYYANQRAAEPNLDEGSPTLTTAEAQRLNRKALFFLGGIVLLLMLLGYFVLFGKDDDETPAVARQSDTEVAVPRAPTALPPDLPAEDPNAALMQQQVEPLPVLPNPPPDEMAYSSGTGGRDRDFDSGPRPPSLMERRMGAAGAAAGQAAGAPASAAGGDTRAAEAQAAQMQALQNAMLGLPPGGVANPTVAMAPTNAQFLSNPKALLVRGTYLRCVLESRIITDIPGYTSCILTEPVYSVNGRQLLLPKGSKILGQYKDQEKEGIARVAVVWDRIVTPTGMDVTMSSPGVDGLGGAGHPGDLNNHWGQKIASALLVSLISDAFSYAAAKNGPETSVFTPGGTVVQQPFQSATARSMERLANQALEKSARRPSTVTINQGTVVNVYVAQDVDFSGVMAVR